MLQEMLSYTQLLDVDFVLLLIHYELNHSWSKLIELMLGQTVLFLKLVIFFSGQYNFTGILHFVSTARLCEGLSVSKRTSLRFVINSDLKKKKPAVFQLKLQLKQLF